ANHVARQLITRTRIFATSHGLVDQVDTHLTGDFTRSGTAHAVTDRKQVSSLRHCTHAVFFAKAAALGCQVRNEEVVFVVLTDLPNVGSTEESELDRTCRGFRVGGLAHALWVACVYLRDPVYLRDTAAT